MDDAKAAGLRHRDGKTRFRHRIHGGGHQGNAEFDGFGQSGSGIHLAGQNFGRAGDQKNVVECEGFSNTQGALLFPRAL